MLRVGRITMVRRLKLVIRYTFNIINFGVSVWCQNTPVSPTVKIRQLVPLVIPYFNKLDVKMTDGRLV